MYCSVCSSLTLKIKNTYFTTRHMELEIWSTLNLITENKRPFDQLTKIFLIKEPRY